MADLAVGLRPLEILESTPLSESHPKHQLAEAAWKAIAACRDPFSLNICLAVQGDLDSGGILGEAEVGLRKEEVVV